MPNKSPTSRFERGASVVAAAERKIQARVDRSESGKPKTSKEAAVQAGPRQYPEPPLPR